jgi:hypothetical protein
VSAARTIFVLDGHDAAGKTTLARRLTDALGAAYVRPFAGTAGIRLLQLAAHDPEEMALFATDVLDAAADAAGGDVLVFDRHWMTVCSLLPERLWPLYRRETIQTALCWADLPTTIARLEARGEPRGPVNEHARYLDIYGRLARRYDCLRVRTDVESTERSLVRLLAWSEQHLPITVNQGAP